MKVHSSNIEEAFYSHKGSFLIIVFKSGSAYLYQDVPLHIWEEFKNFKSKGKYFYYNIREKFFYQKIKSAPSPEVVGFEALTLNNNLEKVE